jgi:hypothetical protein
MGCRCELSPEFLACVSAVSVRQCQTTASPARGGQNVQKFSYPKDRVMPRMLLMDGQRWWMRKQVYSLMPCMCLP